MLGKKRLVAWPRMIKHISNSHPILLFLLLRACFLTVWLSSPDSNAQLQQLDPMKRVLMRQTQFGTREVR